MDTSFFSKLENNKPFMKVALQGFAGSGKTYTAALILIGIYKRINSKKPIVLFDTERSAKFLIPLFEEAKIEALLKESRSLKDLQTAMKFCREGGSDFLFIDSVSHIWENFLEKYKESKHRTRLEFQDWGVIKPTWKKEFSEPFVYDPYNIIMTGRAGYEYENEVNEDTGKREIYKSGVKMKVEGETAYEPDILVNMERFEKILTDKKEIWREATILKDRNNILDGVTIKNPTYESFAPSLELTIKNAVASERPIEADPSTLMEKEENKWQYKKDIAIALEKIEGALTKAFPGQSAEAKRTKIEALEFAFRTTSWTEISTKISLDKLEIGLDLIQEFIQGKIEKQKLEGILA